MKRFIRASHIATCVAFFCVFTAAQKPSVPGPKAAPAISTRDARLFALEDLKPGMKGVAYSVFSGKEPQEFGVEILGVLPVHDLEQMVGIPLTEDGVTTTSGWVTQRLGGFAKVGDVLTIGPCTLRGEEMDDTRVARLRLQRVPEAEEPL